MRNKKKKKKDIRMGEGQHEGAALAESSVQDGCNRFQQGKEKRGTKTEVDTGTEERGDSQRLFQKQSRKGLVLPPVTSFQKGNERWSHCTRK